MSTLPRATSKSLGNCSKQLVSCGMSESVIDRPEVVEVDEQERELAFGALCLSNCALQTISEQSLVGETGK